MQKVDHARRALMIGGVATVLSTSQNANAQTIPQFISTLQFLETPRTVALLYNQLGLMYSIIVSMNILQSGGSLQSPNTLEEIEMPPFTNSGEIFPLLRNLSQPDNAGRRRDVFNELKEDGDPLNVAVRADAHNKLLLNAASLISAANINPQAPLNILAIESLSHAERIASVTLNEGNDSSYLCRIFPFRVIC